MTAASTSTLYDVLGVEPSASDADIKTAYRKLAATAHPDHGGTDDWFRAVKHAFDTLSDPSKRKLYDASLRAEPFDPRRPSPPPPRAPRQDTWAPTTEPHFAKQARPQPTKPATKPRPTPKTGPVMRVEHRALVGVVVSALLLYRVPVSHGVLDALGLGVVAARIPLGLSASMLGGAIGALWAPQVGSWLRAKRRRRVALAVAYLGAEAAVVPIIVMLFIAVWFVVGVLRLLWRVRMYD